MYRMVNRPATTTEWFTSGERHKGRQDKEDRQEKETETETGEGKITRGKKVKLKHENWCKGQAGERKNEKSTEERNG